MVILGDRSHVSEPHLLHRGGLRLDRSWESDFPVPGQHRCLRRGRLVLERHRREVGRRLNRQRVRDLDPLVALLDEAASPNDRPV